MNASRQVPPPEADQLSLEHATVYDLRAAAEQVVTIQARFERWHRAHPEVYEHLLDLCRRWRLAGDARWSIDAALHVLRWERHIEGLEDESESFRINNSFSSRYARLLMDEHPELRGLFETRGLHS